MVGLTFIFYLMLMAAGLAVLLQVWLGVSPWVILVRTSCWLGLLGIGLGAANALAGWIKTTSPAKTETPPSPPVTFTGGRR